MEDWEQTKRYQKLLARTEVQSIISYLQFTIFHLFTHLKCLTSKASIPMHIVQLGYQSIHFLDQWTLDNPMQVIRIVNLDYGMIKNVICLQEIWMKMNC